MRERERSAFAPSPVVPSIPGLALAVTGLLHPHHLTYATSDLWCWLHVGGLVLFPLVGWALANLVHGRSDVLAWATRISAYAYATFYTALDAVSGIAAGYVIHAMGPGRGPSESLHLMFRIGTLLGNVGSWSLMICVALIALDSVIRHRLPGSAAFVLLPAAWLVHRDHIFSPFGVVGMFLIGVLTGALAWMARSDARNPASGPST